MSRCWTLAMRVGVRCAASANASLPPQGHAVSAADGMTLKGTVRPTVAAGTDTQLTGKARRTPLASLAINLEHIDRLAKAPGTRDPKELIERPQPLHCNTAV